MTDSNNLSVLVTGAAGMLGGAMVAHLAADPRFNPVAATRSTSTWRSVGLPAHVIGNISHQTDWRQALAGCDAIVHCAARAHVIHETAADAVAEFHKVNVEGTVTLATQAMEMGVRHFVLISSAGVHGTTNMVPAREEDELHPAEAYALSKLEAERCLHRIAAGSDMAVTILRPPLIYGPGVRGNMLRLMRLVLSGIPIPLGAVNNARSFVGVSNLCNAIATVLLDDRARGRTYLVSDQSDISTAELIRTIAMVAGRRVFLPTVPVRLLRLAATLLGRQALVDRLVGSLTVDSHAITAELGWSPPVPVAHDVTRMVKWFTQQQQSGHRASARLLTF